MKKTVLFLASLLLIGSLSAQRNCATMQNLERLKALDPSLELKMQDIEQQTQNAIVQQSTNRGMNAIINIPVVVHVVYNTTAQNISDAQIKSQIDVLNEDFRRLNADKVNTPSAFASTAADAEVTFCLASKAPNGTATSGIVRKSTTVTSFSDNDGVKYSSSGGDDAWPTGSYLNLWVCNLGGGLLGYAQFPGGPTATDGVVILYTAFGRGYATNAPYDKGRTATHEVGHWLNLRHIWGDASCGSDLVSDTPTQQTSNYSCPSYPHLTCSNTTSGDEFMNYMDYTDDGCMNMFSLGQKSRMQALFVSGGARASLTASTGCGSTSTTCNVPASLSATNITSSSVTTNWGSTGASSYNVRIKATSSTTWSTASTTSTSQGFTGLTASTTYEFQVQSVCGTSTSSYSASATFSTGATSTSTSTTLSIGSGTGTMVAPYGTYYMDEKSQFIITKAELVAAGYTSSNNVVKALAFNVYSASSQVMNGFTIKMRTTTASSFGSTSFFGNSTMTTVYSANKSVTTGWNTHTFTTPYTYNGTDNLLIEICWDNSSYTTDTKVYCSTLSTYNTIFKQQDVSSGGICAATTGVQTATRPNMKLTMGSSTTAKFNGETAVAAPAIDFLLYPNPASTMLNIDYNVEAENAKVIVSMYNMMGALVNQVDQGTVAAGLHNLSFDLASNYSSLPNGIYLISLNIDGKMETKRFILTR